MDLTHLKHAMVTALEEMEGLPNEFYCLFHIPEADEIHIASQVDYYKLKISGEYRAVNGLGFANAAVLRNILHHVPWDQFLAELRSKVANYDLDYSGISLSQWRTYHHHQPNMPEA